MDLSLKPDLVQAAQSARKRSKKHPAEEATLPAVSALHALCDPLPLTGWRAAAAGRGGRLYYPKTVNPCLAVSMQERMHTAHGRPQVQANCPDCCAGMDRSAKR